MCGGTCSGKTTISNRLKQLFENNISVVSIDNYYIAHPELPIEERKNINYDEPNSIDVSRLIEDLKSLKSGHKIVQPVFSYKTFLNEFSDNTTYPEKVIIVEGLFAFSFPELVDMYDFKIFIDADADIRLSRRISRDLTIYNRPLDFVMKQYFDYAKPMHDLHVEPKKSIADITISGNFINDKVYELILKLVSV